MDTNTNAVKTVVANPILDEDTVYTVVKNKAKNTQVCLSQLNGITVAAGETVNLRAMFRKSQLIEASQEIHHFISIGLLEDLSSVKVAVQDQQTPQVNQIQEDLKKRVEQAKLRDVLAEINGCSTLTRLEDIILNPQGPAESSPEVKKAAKLQYMKLRAWVDDDGNLIPGSTDDNNQDIVSVDSWEFQPFTV